MGSIDYTFASWDCNPSMWPILSQIRFPTSQYCQMKQLFRLFFKSLRFVLGPFLLLWERVAARAGIVRSESEQDRVDEETEHLSLFQFKTCPFCIRTRLAVRRLSLKIKKFDAQHDPTARNELLNGGGEIRVPCLKIEESNGEIRWLYDSVAIIRYLEQRFQS